MQIISHRGLWKNSNEKNELESFERSFNLNFGTETDIRDLNGELVISHDMPNVKKQIGDTISYADNPYTALQDADALLIVTEWSVFRNPDFELMEQKLKNKVIFDGRNLYDLQKMIDLGFYYNSIGRRLITAHKSLSEIIFTNKSNES